jgi:hypothetical protein
MKNFVAGRKTINNQSINQSNLINSIHISINSTKIDFFVCLFCFESHEQFFSYLVTVTITGDRAANLDLYASAYGF